MSDDPPRPGEQAGEPLPPPPAPGWTSIPNGDGPAGLAPPPVWPVPPSGYGYGFPAQPYVVAPIAKPDSNLVGAVLVTLFCCLPFGIVSIVYAAQVDSKWNAGDWQGAERASKLAKTWGLVAIGAGILFSLLYVVTISSSGGSR